MIEEPDYRQPGLLRADHERSRSRATKQRDELAALQSIKLHLQPQPGTGQHIRLARIGSGGLLRCGILTRLTPATGHIPKLPHRNIYIRFASISRHKNLGENVTAVGANYVDVMEQVSSGKERKIADSGYKDIEVTTWNGIVAPAKTPSQTTAFLGALFTSALAAPDIKTKLMSLGMFPSPMLGADFGAYLKGQNDYYARCIHELNIKAE